MALVTVQRSPSPSGSAETEEHDTADADESNLKSPRQRRRRSKSALKKLRKLFNTVRFVSKLKPCFSESYFTVKGAALILPQNDYEGAYARKPSKSQGELQTHLQAMFSLLRPQDIITVAVKLEGTHTRYLAVVSCIGRQDTEESVILGVNLKDKPEIGLIVPIWAHTKIELDGDGGFSIKSDLNIHIFKPVSVQAMWSALQSLNKVVKIATDKLYIPRGLTHTWVGYYEAKLSKDTSIVSEWNYKADIDASYRLKSSKVDPNTADEDEFYRQLKTELKLLMMQVDLEEVTCKYLREALEEKLGMDLRKYKGLIDLQMFEIMGQMDAPSLILDHLYLGSEWNASNLEELQENGVQYILNISREIDNFFTGILHYMNVREWDVEQSNLLKYWEDTYKFINKARKRGSKTLVHCKMGMSRSASTVIAYLMKEYKWSLKEAHDFTKAKRSIINPNSGFWKQLETYEGILKASWNRTSFEQKSDHADRPGDIEEEVDEQELLSAEDMLAINLGKHLPESSDLPFLHTEQDIEIASRSADSTEESLPDQLSPDVNTDGQANKQKRFNRFDSNVAESGDYISSDSSEDTDSDELSSDGDGTEDKVFQAIDIPESSGAVGQGKKKIVKPKSRRVKSESDKTLLTIDEGTGQAISRESSVSKFKPDGSWIKTETEEEGDPNKPESAEQGVDRDAQDGAPEVEHNTTSEVDIKTLDSNATADTQGESVDKGVEKEVISNDESKSGQNIQIENKETNVPKETSDQDDSNVLEPYLKENIPWNIGTVRKQKQDLEEKFGSGAQRSDSLTEKDKSDKLEEANKAEIVEHKAGVTQTAVDTDESVDEKAHEQTKVEQTDEIKSKPEETETEQKDSGSPKCRRSVYELEEISLPEGLVRKAMQEIEERNRLSESESPRKRLHRSSSLKSNRVTPKAKNRDSERRKTCIAILSPTYHRSDSNQSATADDRASTDTDLSVDLGQAQSSVDTEEHLQTGTVKIYKFMGGGEEVTVQEGMVRKQTLDIEHKAKETTTKQISLKFDKQQSEHNSSENELSGSPTAVKQTSHPTTAESSLTLSNDDTASVQNIPDIATPTKTSVTSEEKCVDDSSICTVESIKQSFMCDKARRLDDLSSSDDQASRDSDISMSVGQRSKHGSRPESCFDSETLHLIREIGSALMNSPAKLDLEEPGGEVREGESLVNHFVRKIENNIKLSKTSVKREIIIVDKEKDKSTEQISNIPIIHSTDQAKQTICDAGEIIDQHESSKGSPVARRYTFPSSPKSDRTAHSNLSSPSLSPVGRKELLTDKSNTAEHDKQQHDTSDNKPADHHNTTADKHTETVTQDNKAETSDKSESSDNEGCSVRSLVDMFSAQAGSSPPNMSVLDTHVTPSTTASASSGNTGAVTSGATTHVSPGARSPPQHDRHVLKHRQSEPAISLSEKSLQMFSRKIGGDFAQIDREIVLEERNTESVELRSKTERPERPKSGGHVHDTSGAYGGSRRPILRQSQTLSESENSPVFSWEGKKVKTKKTYGKSHPLAKLESRRSMDSIRNSPFYNTM